MGKLRVAPRTVLTCKNIFVKVLLHSSRMLGVTTAKHSHTLIESGVTP